MYNEDNNLPPYLQQQNIPGWSGMLNNMVRALMGGQGGQKLQLGGPSVFGGGNDGGNKDMGGTSMTTPTPDVQTPQASVMSKPDIQAPQASVMSKPDMPLTPPMMPSTPAPVSVMSKPDTPMPMPMQGAPPVEQSMAPPMPASPPAFGGSPSSAGLAADGSGTNAWPGNGPGWLGQSGQTMRALFTPPPSPQLTGTYGTNQYGQ